MNRFLIQMFRCIVRRAPHLAAVWASLSLVNSFPVMGGDLTLLARTNLVAWCIVPFDAAKRGPVERAQMLNRLGIQKMAYDWRAEHIPTFDAEIAAMRAHNIEITSWWTMPTWGADGLDSSTRAILAACERNGLQTQFWALIGEPLPGSTDLQAKARAGAAQLRPFAEAAERIGCQVALYNHGGWFGEPENQVAIIRELNLPNVGIVYNFHHGHPHIERFKTMFDMMKPHLLALNLNGMMDRGDAVGHKILNLSAGNREREMIQVVIDSAWRGPVGILDHRDETDSEKTLSENLRGLDWLIRELDSQGSAGERPFGLAVPKLPPPSPAPPAPTGARSLSPAFGRALAGGMVVPGRPDYRVLPITVECRVRLDGAAGFNILIASDAKASAAHWELYSYAGAGDLSLYMPGRGGEYRTGQSICDGEWHRIGMILEAQRVRLFMDGRVVLDKAVPELKGQAVPGDLAFGRLVEGGIGCDGLVDDIRISRGIRPIPLTWDEPLERDDATLNLWSFDELSQGDSGSSAAGSDAAAKGRGVKQPWKTSAFWAVEDSEARAELPEAVVLSAAKPERLTRSNGKSVRGQHRIWHRSHGDAHGTRYAALSQIHRGNVRELRPAWTYRSGDGSGNIQCNPIIVDGTIFAPTVGESIVAVDAVTGVERWRFKPGGRPAHRGLLYWPGEGNHKPRLLFNAGDHLYAVDPATGKPLADFGVGGKVATGPVVVAGAVFKHVLVIPGFHRDVYGYDVRTGAKLWHFNTIPGPGESGAETWDKPGTGANCWGGMALDEHRGVAYIATGSPKPNFIGIHHRGDNLFANCVLALDALTGRYIWHFQEIRHDIWDLDIPAAPNLVTVQRHGVEVDAVAQVTKLGNTLLLDRMTGEPLFDVPLRRAPTSALPGERTAAHQPDIQYPEPFARQVFSSHDVTDRTPEAREYVEAQIQRANFGWFEPFEDGVPTVFYGIHGGAEWTGAAVDPKRGILYVSSNELPWIITVHRTDDIPRPPGMPLTRGERLYQEACATCHGLNREGVGVSPPLQGLRHRMTDEDVSALLNVGRNLMPAAPPMSSEDRIALLDHLFLRDRPNSDPKGEAPPVYTSDGYKKLLDHEGYPGSKPPWGTLNAIDLNSGKRLWQVPLGEYPELTADGHDVTGTENFGGPIVTAGGLVFCAGTRDEKIRAFDSDTGEELWSWKLPWGGYAPPATYEIDGRQYVVIAATGGGKLGGGMGDAYVAFCLGEGTRSGSEE